jgi:hypothetical protein
MLYSGCLVEPLENRGSYYPFSITLFRPKYPEPFVIELAADDQKTRKQCIAVIKVASTLTRSVKHSKKYFDATVCDVFCLRTRNLEKRNLL